jgi:hypothetical protein
LHHNAYEWTVGVVREIFEREDVQNTFGPSKSVLLGNPAIVCYSDGRCAEIVLAKLMEAGRDAGIFDEHAFAGVCHLTCGLSACDSDKRAVYV